MTKREHDAFDDMFEERRRIGATITELSRERDAALAMLDEILALDDVETPGHEENVASVVNDALVHLRAERDEALALLHRFATVNPWEPEIAGPDTCHYCAMPAEHHDDDCPWVAARKLLERTER